MTAAKRRGPAGDRASSKQCDDKHSGQGTEPPADAARPGADVLVEHLTGVEEISFGKWKSLCPCHEDTVASLYIDVKPRRFDGLPSVFMNCKGCGANGDAVLDALGLTSQRRQIFNEGNGVYLQRPPKYVENLTEAYVEKCEAFLHGKRDLLAYVTEVRGVSEEVVTAQRIGFDEGRQRYTLPVYDIRNRHLVNVRRYTPTPPEGSGKMVNAAGHGTARLYVAKPRPRPLRGRPVLVCEGEWDALVAASNGFRAVSGTHGANTWMPAWSRCLSTHDVAFVYDCDEAGRTNAAKHAADVARYARSVRVVDLDPTRHDGFDLSDWLEGGRWFTNGGTGRDLLALVRSVTPLGQDGGGVNG